MGILDKKPELENKELNRNPYPWALKHFQDGVANNWTVQEVPLQDDSEQWNVPGKLSEGERTLVLKNLKFFGVSEALTQDNISMAIFPHIQDGYVRMALIRQAYEEALHSQTFLTVAESLNIKIDEVYEEYKNTPSVKAKIDFINDFIGATEQPGFDITTVQGKQALLKDLFGFFMILEGTFFFTNFAMLYSLRRKNRMKGLAKFIDYISRDESVHIQIGVDLISTIIREYPDVMTTVFKLEIETLFERAIKLEDAYIDDVLGTGLGGLNPEEFKQYVRFIANRRLSVFGLLERWPGMKNPFLWMSTETDLMTESNFFETRVTEYQTGKADMDF